MLKKLRLKFVLVNMIIVTVMLCVILSLAIQHTGAGLKQESEEVLRMLAHGVTDQGNADVRVPYFVIEVGLDGKATITGSTHYDLNDGAFVQGVLKEVYKQDELSGVLEKYDLRYMAVRGTFASRIAFVDISADNDAINSMIRSCVLIGVAALGAFFVISSLLARWAIKPVKKAWEEQQRFVSDASHELKTPLTVIMSNAELLQNPEFDAEDKEKFANSILTMSRQMRSLVEGMLDLARADNGQVGKSFERIAFSSLLEGTILPFEPVFYEKGLHLRAEITPNIYLHGNAGYLHQVVEILLDNAAKYTEKGLVQVQLHRYGRNSCLLTVANPGAPIAPEEQERIFDRFYRSDAARSRTGSFGLGLPIAQSIVQEHRGKIWVLSNSTGNCFCVLLPCENEK